MDTVEPQWSESEGLSKTAVMDIIEPQRPDCGSLIKTTAMDIVEPQIANFRACGLRPDVW